jgi:uncharacterized membrane protein
VKLRVAAIAVAVIGLGIASYLTIVHYSGGTSVCAIAHGCETVQKSEYSKLAGVPVALLGLLGYLGILAALIKDDEHSRTAAAFLSFLGFGFSAWLTYTEIALIDAICIWCVGSAICMTILTALNVSRVLTLSPAELARVR